MGCVVPLLLLLLRQRQQQEQLDQGCQGRPLGWSLWGLVEGTI
jgi:hypothetical protein